jgi:type IV pilus assembly protein PilW
VNKRSKFHCAHSQAGYSLIELSVAILIGLFLLGGVLTLMQDNKRTFTNQNQLAQLHDTERMVMTMITDVIQSTGYYPNPATYNPSVFFTAAGTLGAGQTITGTYSATAPGDTIKVRYATLGGDNILNCSGSSNTDSSTTTHVYINTFSISNGQLICTLLVDNVALAPITLAGVSTTTGPQSNGAQTLSLKNMSILYGVNTSASGNNVDTYMTAAEVTAAGKWNSILTAWITLTFNNPLYVTAGQGQPQTISFQRVVGVMNQFGIKL